MLRDEFANAGEQSPQALRNAYERVLMDTIDAVGVETVLAEADVDEETVYRIRNADPPGLTLADAATILALANDRPDAETITAEARDILLMGMTQAVLDVDAIQSGLGGEMTAKEIQQKIEGRYPITLDEYARIHHFIASKQ